jgi:pimeloyl-ACP methyl ester carboxylesterase
LYPFLYRYFMAFADGKWCNDAGDAPCAAGLRTNALPSERFTVNTSFHTPLRMAGALLAVAALVMASAGMPARAAALLPPNGHVVQTGNIMTYYEDFGSGPPLIVLHGSLGSTADWAQVAPELAKSYRVIVVDSRGRGRSTDDITPLIYHQMMSDTLLLMDALGITRTHLLGWSDGAIIGLDMAIHHPERLASLVSYGGQYNVEAGTQFFDDFVRVMTIADMKEWADGYRAVSPQPDRAELELEKVRSMLLYLPDYSKKQLKDISVPVLVLDGANEEIVEPTHARELSKLIPGSKLVIMPGTGHFAPYEQPAEFTRIVLDFLKTQKIQ